MKYFQEVTEWADKTPNHIYYLSDDKTSMVGYIRSGTKDLFKFKAPIRIDVRGRKFKVLDMKAEADTVYFKKSEPAKDVITVQGSNGKEYQVEKIGNKYVCSCPGFMFRHKCKHIEGLK